MGIRVWKAIPWFIVAAVGVGLAVLASTGGSVLGQSTTVRVVSPETASVGDTVVVRIDIQDAINLAGYEWFLTYDPTLLELVQPSPDNPNPQNDGFLPGATCPPPADPPGAGGVRMGCATVTQAGVSGSGVLSFVAFNAIANGSGSLCVKYAQLADPLGGDIPTGAADDSIAIGGGSPPPPSCAPPATPTPSSPPPDYIPPTGGATETPVPPGPTVTPASPPGPTPTPAPTPPPEQADTVDLAAVCNPVTVTYPDGTTVQTLAAAISPADILGAMWLFNAGLWQGYSPRYPEASDLATTRFLDVVFLCVGAPGTFVRPLA